MTPMIRPAGPVVIVVVILVEILITEDCPNEDAAINLVGMAAQYVGVAPRLQLTEVGDLNQAEQHRFVGSPTIRVNGRDIAPPAESQQEVSLACRLYDTTEGLSGVPELTLIRVALEKAHAAEGS